MIRNIRGMNLTASDTKDRIRSGRRDKFASLERRPSGAVSPYGVADEPAHLRDSGVGRTLHRARAEIHCPGHAGPRLTGSAEDGGAFLTRSGYPAQKLETRATPDDTHPLRQALMRRDEHEHRTAIRRGSGPTT